jgi:UDP-N-acetylglucosamine--N-acetylmuramyl-(pentapeptide) pyrophosphoryl-undecaprenol N-acetylglucosamine transferase
MTPGLANKLAMPSASRVCCNFPETLEYLPKEKAVLTGSPIRQELRQGNKLAALDFCGFTANKPTLMIIGGSLGAANVNAAIRGILPDLLKTFQVVHLCGKGKMDDSLIGTEGYVQFEYIKKELADLFALSDVVVSRAGANAICELLDLRKPALLIPLGSSASRGDQILNAESFRSQGFCEVMTEDVMTPQSLLDTILKLYHNRAEYIQAMEKSQLSNAIETITNLIEEVAAK